MSDSQGLRILLPWQLFVIIHVEIVLVSLLLRNIVITIFPIEKCISSVITRLVIHGILFY